MFYNLCFSVLFCRKTMCIMKKTYLIFCLIVLCLSSCLPNTYLDLFPRSRRFVKAKRQEESKEKEKNPDTTPKKKIVTDIYVSALSYPTNYNWEIDPNHYKVEANLILYENYKKIVEIPTGLGQVANNEYDNHKIIDGHIYNYNIVNGRTIIAIDGKIKFSYKTKENIKALVVKNDEIHTLSIKQGTNTLRYRCNGQLLFEDNGAELLDNILLLYQDDNSMCFAYYKESEGRDYYLVIDGKSKSINYDKSEEKLVDIVRHKGIIYRLIKKNDKRTYLFVANEQKSITNVERANYEGFNLLKSDDKIVIKAYKIYNKQILGTMIWNSDGYELDYISSLGSLLNTSSAYVKLYNHNNSMEFEFDASKKIKIAGMYRSLYPNSLYFDKKDILIALNHKDRKHNPILWYNNKIQEFPINGILTSVCLVRREE